MMKLKELKESLSNEDIISLLTALGADRYNDKDSHIIFPTICHNVDPSSASMKLYYYKEDKLFHCYTGCGESFDIYGLFKKWYAVRGIENYSFKELIYDKIVDRTNFVDSGEDAYISKKEKYGVKKLRNLQKPFLDEVLEVFDKRYPEEWLAEGISKEAMDKFNILFSMSRNQIIIPHYDINERLVGIRGRLLNEEEARLYGKYMPVFIEDTVYKHRLMFNLYGINKNKEAIKRKRAAIIFESEKSVLKYESMFDTNISVAVCGSSISKPQIDLLVGLGVENIVVAFDKEYEQLGTKKAEEYFMKLMRLCEKYKQHMNISFMYDRESLLKEKDSPIDLGKKVFLRLLEKRVEV